MKVEQVIVSPEKARELLAMNVCNRPISHRAVARLAESMKNGEWKQNGDTICVSDGVLVDGQHRLSAIIESGVSIPVILVNGLQEGAFATKDCGKRRSISDYLSVVGEVNTAKLSSAAVMALSVIGEWEGKRMQASSGGGVAASSVISFVSENTELRRFIMLRTKQYVGRPSCAAALLILAYRQNMDATTFVARVYDGVGLSANNAAYVLRDTLLRKSNKSTLSRRYEMAYWIKAWNSWKLDSKVSFMRFKEEDDFPRFA